jgi:TRAP-type C4-dicarboxylate transport system permease small subunit
MMLGAAMAVQENGTINLDYFAMLRGWEMAR